MKTTPANFLKAIAAHDLDAMMTPDEAAKYMKLCRNDVLAKSKGGHRAKIPAFRYGAKTVRYTRRAILAKGMHDAGMSYELIAAAFGSAPGKRKETA